MKKSFFTSLSFILMALVIIFNNCTAQKKNIKLFNDTIILASKETKKIKGTDIKLKLQNCSLAIYKGGEERPYCELSIDGDSQKSMLNHLFDMDYINTLAIQIIAINPWSTEENGIPAGGCKVHIYTAPAVLLLKQYQKEAIQLINTDSISIPSNCCIGAAFTLYAHATEAIGFKLNSLAGKTFTIQKWKLTNIEKRTGLNYIAIILLDENKKAITGWIAVDPHSGMAPGLYPLNATQLQ